MEEMDPGIGIRPVRCPWGANHYYLLLSVRARLVPTEAVPIGRLANLANLVKG